MPTINHVVTIAVGGLDRTADLLKDSLFIRTSVGNKGDECSFRLRNAGSVNVIEWQEVTVSVNGTAVFGGYINRVTRRGAGSGSAKEEWIDVFCRDWSSLFDRIVVNRGYTDTADTDVIQDLFGTYLYNEWFDAASNVFAVNADIDIYFENITFREALTTLGAVCQAEWHVAPDKSLYWYSKTNPDDAAFNIDVVAPDNSTTFDILADSLSVSSDATAIVNKIRVIGGEEQTGIVTDTFVASGTQTLFGPLTKKPGSIRKVTWRDATNVEQINWPGFVGYEPEDTLYADGGEFTTLINLESRYVTIMDGNRNGPYALSNVVVEYYALEPVEVTVESATSQASYGQVFEQTVYDDTLTSRAIAQDYGERVIEEYAFGRETITFDVAEHGLLPGRLITINAPVLGLTDTYDDALALETGIDALLLESGDRLMLENYGQIRQYLIQSVSIRTVVTGSNQFMLVATVQCGKYIPTLIDSLMTIRQFTGASGRLPAKRTIGRLDQLTSNLGDIFAGRAVFTDGGTAPFAWDNYADHTGVVIGLEDNGANAYGAMYILDDGAVKAKIGRMNGLGSVGTVAPTGWGIWTENGYFSGVVAATAGEIGGWTIANNQIYANGGTIATRALPINSSNPGVYLTSAGLFGYGTLGLTFSIPTDPALRPIFSSGTILNTVYEVSTSSVIRTGTTNPRVQIDNSGIFAYDSGGVARFTVDSSTGQMAATKGTFSGTISAAVFTGGTVTQGTISAAQISGGTVIGAVFTGGTVTQGTISAAQVTGGTVTGARVTGGTITGGLITGQSITGGTITGGLISGGTVTGALVTGGTINAGGGNVILSANGVALVPLGSYTNSASNNKIQWFSGGTVMSEIVGVWNGFFAETWVVAGAGGKTGYNYQRSYLSGTGGYCTWALEGNQARFEITGSNKFLIDADEVRTYVNILPESSANNTQLGDSSHGFRYLYLKDDSGNVRRVSINSSGVLTVT